MYKNKCENLILGCAYLLNEISDVTMIDEASFVVSYGYGVHCEFGEGCHEGDRQIQSGFFYKDVDATVTCLCLFECHVDRRWCRNRNRLVEVVHTTLTGMEHPEGREIIRHIELVEGRRTTSGGPTS